MIETGFLIEAIHEREQQLRDITDQLLAGGADSVDAHLSDIRSFVTQRLRNLCTLLSGDPVSARKELPKHVSEIRMMPQAGDGRATSRSSAKQMADRLRACRLRRCDPSRHDRWCNSRHPVRMAADRLQLRRIRLCSVTYMLEVNQGD
jgi:hypothetical protein